MSNKPGTFLISLDFELMWGMFDKVTTEQYGANIEAVHLVIPRLLKLFAERNIHATWATVGMLMYENKAALEAALPTATPQYTRGELSAYEHFSRAEISENDPLYFAPKLVREIINTPGQELASHTFSHYYCREAQSGGEGEAFAADCTAMQAAAHHYKVRPCSIVFPRNQWSNAALAEIRQHGITCYRGTEDHFLYRARTDESQNQLFIRGLRLLDHYLNLSGHHTYPAPVSSKLINLPASRFLRPYSNKLALLESLRLRRIKNAMTHAAKRGEVFHLWWHPHNFGSNTEENFQALTTILDHFTFLRSTYSMESKTMRAVATQSDE